MEYRIEYARGKCCNFAHSRTDLMEWLGLLKDEAITDIRKIYKSGASQSVMERYQKYIKSNALSRPKHTGHNQNNYKVIIDRKGRKSNEKV